MKTKQLGRAGLRVSEICLGTMTFGNQADSSVAREIMDTAVAGGVTFFDTADVYPLGGTEATVGRTEEIVGRWLHDRGCRDDIVLATKCRGSMGHRANDEGLSRKHVMAACEASLRRLGTEYIDLYQVHAPDPSTPIEETLRAMDTLVLSGKVRYVGCSNYPAWRLADALWTSEVHGLARFDCDQPRYNLLFRMIEDEIVPLCDAHGVGIIAYNPLAGGMLTGRYGTQREVREGTRFALEGAGELYRKRYWRDAVFDAVEALQSSVEARGKLLVHVALAWVLAQPGITSAIVGASKAEQLRQSLAAVDVVLDSEDLAACEEAWFALPRERDPQVRGR
jgi:aryl-alcohol dehydrogenase-like predicted oxidoreductase